MTFTEKLKSSFKFVFLMNFSVFTPSAIPEDHSWEAFEVPTRQFQCLVRTLYHEARNQPDFGVMAVGAVVLNRVNSGKYPDTICEVVKQKWKGTYQFSFWADKKALQKPVDKKSWERVKKLAHDTVQIEYSGFDIVEGATHYHAAHVRPLWSKSKKMKKIIKIKDHIFYRYR